MKIEGMPMFSKILDVLNDLKPKHLLMLAGTTALLIFAVVYFALSGLTEKGAAPVTPVAPQGITRSVVVARDDIQPNTLIQEDMLEIKEMPANVVPKGSIMVMKDILGQPAASTIYAGDILTMSKVFMDKSHTGFSGSIPDNCRAVSVGVSEITGVAGFAKPGDYVDVILVEKSKTGASSRFLLQNVLLLAVNQNAAAKGNVIDEATGKKAESKPAIATLALTPDDMLELVSASAVGEIYLALRPFHSKDIYTGFGEFNLKSSQVETVAPAASTMPAQAAPAYQPPVAAAPQPEAPVASSGIRIIQGDKILGK